MTPTRMLLTLAGTSLLASLAQAQLPPNLMQQPQPGAFRLPPPQQQLANQPVNQTQVTQQQPTTYPQGNFNYNPWMYGGYGGGYGYGGYYPGRVGGALNGVAAVTTANAQYQGIIQDARLQQSYANQSHLDYRKKAIEEWKYEQSLKPTPEDIAAQDQAQALRRARENPSNVEIWSGSILNTLYDSIKKMQLGGLRGPMVPLDPQVLHHINLTDGTTGGSVGLLRDGAQLQWPMALRTATFAPNRQAIEKLAQDSVKQAKMGGVQDQTLFNFIDAVDALKAKVDGSVNTMAPTPYIQACRYVNELKDTLKALQDPNTVRKQFSGQWTAQGNTVNELVDQLTRQGLKFAPVNPGEETYYTSLYNSLLSYDMGLYQLAYRGPAGGGQVR